MGCGWRSETPSTCSTPVMAAAILTAPDPTINKIAVTVTCSELDEVGPNEALGFEVPIGAVAMQLGARVPTEFSGDRAQSAAVPPYPWPPPVPTGGRAGVHRRHDRHDLDPGPPTSAGHHSDVHSRSTCRPRSVARCSSRVVTRLRCTLTGNVYFASGVYYFEQAGDGIGQRQRGRRLRPRGAPQPRLLRRHPGRRQRARHSRHVRHQRWRCDVGVRQGGAAGRRRRGDDHLPSPPFQPALRRCRSRWPDLDHDRQRRRRPPLADHLVTNVNRVPAVEDSQRHRQPDPSPTPGPPAAMCRRRQDLHRLPTGLTDKARVPLAPTGFTATPLRYFDGATEHGAILMTWNEVTGQAAGGAFIDGYNVTISHTESRPDRCQRHRPRREPVAGVNKVSCLAKNRRSLVVTGLRPSGSGHANAVGVGALGHHPRRQAQVVGVGDSESLDHRSRGAHQRHRCRQQRRRRRPDQLGRTGERGRPDHELRRHGPPHLPPAPARPATSCATT